MAWYDRFIGRKPQEIPGPPKGSYADLYGNARSTWDSVMSDLDAKPDSPQLLMVKNMLEKQSTICCSSSY